MQLQLISVKLMWTQGLNKQHTITPHRIKQHSTTLRQGFSNKVDISTLKVTIL